jgi:predicted transglutaminase-like cysteine proteinase
MLGRVAACAAFLYLWPICTQISDGDGPLPLPEIVIASGHQEAHGAQADVAQVNDAEAEKQTSLPAAAAEQVQAAEANALIVSETAIAFAAEPFGLNAEPVVAGEILAKWGGVEAQIKAESRVLARCRNGGSWCPRSARRFLSIINDGRARNGRARIGVINREINLSIVPTSDLAQWGVADRWSAPLETLAARRGDCEDYAIAKYVALRAAGVPQQDIRLVVVRNNAAREHHAVVAVRLNGDWIILDNRWLALVRDREMWRATPLFEFDDNGVRRFVDPTPTATLQQASPS